MTLVCLAMTARRRHGDGGGFVAFMRKAANAARLLPLAFGLFVFCAVGDAAPTLGNRVALVVGNATYRDASPLASPLNDAEEVAAALAKVGFDVVTLKDARGDDLRQALKTFSERSAKAEMSVVYFAGHSIEYGGENHLVPVDANITTESSIWKETVALRVATLAVARAKSLGLVILDASRKHSFLAKIERRNERPAFDGSQAPTEALRNVLMFFAVEAGKTVEAGGCAQQSACDGAGQISGGAGPRDQLPISKCPRRCAEVDPQQADAVHVRPAFPRQDFPQRRTRAEGFVRGRRGSLQRCCIRAVAHGGVDVVLNSLAGGAMERSIACLRPFGRFVELGKRDYVFNTHIGLRPFRKNLSYFGVDVDQLIEGQKALGRQVYAKVIRLFEERKLTPLPFSVFDAASVSEAFYLMQHSGHVGKILVRPPSQTTVRPEKKPLQISAKGTHVITGAFGGFGLETAKWLVERGARHLVMIGRRGATSSEAKAVVGELTSRGVTILADPCDITDPKAVEKLFKKIRATMPPVAGVLHEAMVLDDAILSNLDAERFRTVLAPKVAGAENLDLFTRSLSLDYFVLFSSVTTLIGNPGQANYVAANAYMEGLARRRRQEGLPAMAIGWGPIVDVGVVARNQKLQSGLQKLTGVTGLRAREALQLMAEALEQASDNKESTVMTISPNDGSFGGNRLPVLRSPTYASFINQESRDGEAARVDLHALAASEGIDAARRKVTDIIAGQLAHVLHSREEDISRTRPLGELGLDSLMALELVMNLEECFGIRIPLVGASGSMTVASIGDEIISHLRLEGDSDKAVATTLAEQHQTSVEAGQIEALKEFMNEEVQKPRRLLS